MTNVTFREHCLRKNLPIQHSRLLLFLFVLLVSTFLQASYPSNHYLISPTMVADLEIDTTGHDEITIAIETNDLRQDLQGKIPVTLISDNKDAVFENGKHQILWHSKTRSLDSEGSETVYNAPFVYMTLGIDDKYLNKILRVRIRKEEDISKLSSVAAFFPQILPIIIMGEVTWGPAPSIFYDALMRWNYRVLPANIIKSTRELILSRSFGKNKPILAQCTADFIEGFLLFESANYGESTGHKRGKIESFRSYMVSIPFKRLVACMSNAVSLTLLDIQKSHVTEDWQYLKNLNKESIDGISKLMVGYGFNAFAFEAGDFFKSIKKTIGFSNAINDAKLQADLDRSLVNATQYLLQSGYEDFFKGQLKHHNLSEGYSLPLATGAGVFEMMWRYHTHQNMQGRERMHQIHSFTKRAEAIGVSINKALALPELDDTQLLMLGVAAPALIYSTLKLATGYYTYSDSAFSLFNAAYEGVVLGALIHLISPVLERYGVWASHAVQKPLLDYIDAEPGSWSEYFMADNIRYRIDVFTENGSLL